MHYNTVYRSLHNIQRNFLLITLKEIIRVSEAYIRSTTILFNNKCEVLSVKLTEMSYRHLYINEIANTVSFGLTVGHVAHLLYIIYP